MSLIAFLAPDESIGKIARELVATEHNDVDVEMGLLSEGVALAAASVAQGTEIVITRGGTASMIKNAGIEVVIVEIPITGFDIIRTVEKAKIHGCCIGAVAFPSMISGINCLDPILGVNIRLYPINTEEEAEARVMEAFCDGANVVIGGFITGRAAQKHKLPFELISSGAEGILQSILEAKRIAQARNLEKTKTGLFQAVLNYAYDGIVLIDDKYRVTFLNPVAEHLIGIRKEKATGKKIAQIWPSLKLKQVIDSKYDNLGQILKLNDIDVLCNKVPIVVNNKTAGAVVTFQDVTQIQKMEAHVRHRIYTSGHVATITFKDIIGISAIINKTIEIAKDFALTHSSILIIGETGTGKEVFSQSIHNYSDRSQGPFVAINCAALPSQILESELFGYAGGAFTGANPKGKQGLFELAHGGTIFLDEIGEIDPVTQSKLLRVLQEKKVMRLGSDNIIQVDVRIIAASNKDLRRLVNENKFRSDLYYRLNVLQLKTPPLRERKEDIKLLAQFFLNENAGITKYHLKLSPSAIQALTNYTWPGNIRELQNIVQRILAIHKKEIIDAVAVNNLLEDKINVDYNKESIIPNELAELQQALAISKGKYSEAAKILGINRSTLWRKLKKLGLK